jgi:hypothetical protein
VIGPAVTDGPVRRLPNPVAALDVAGSEAASLAAVVAGLVAGLEDPASASPVATGGAAGSAPRSPPQAPSSSVARHAATQRTETWLAGTRRRDPRST